MIFEMQLELNHLIISMKLHSRGKSSECSLNAGGVIDKTGGDLDNLARMR